MFQRILTYYALGKAVYQKLRDEAPDLVPLLDALAEDDYDKATEVFLSYGTVEELVARLPEAAKPWVAVVGPVFWKGVDAIVPEEKILEVMKQYGIA